MHPNQIAMLLKSLFGDLFGQAQAQPASAQPAASSFNMGDMFASQERTQNSMLNFLREPTQIKRRTISGNLESDVASGARVEGLDALYKMNPHLNPTKFASPTDPARFNTAVWGNPAGQPAYQPPTGTEIKGGVEVPMTPASIFTQLAGMQSKPIEAFGSGTNAPQPGPATIQQNGVIAPMDLFLKGARNAGTKDYQLGLTPAQLAQLGASPTFGKAPTKRRIY